MSKNAGSRFSRAIVAERIGAMAAADARFFKDAEGRPIDPQDGYAQGKTNAGIFHYSRWRALMDLAAALGLDWRGLREQSLK